MSILRSPAVAVVGGALVASLALGLRPVGPGGSLGVTAEQAEILNHLSLRYLDDGAGGLAKTIEITGVNVRLVNGLGATNGNPAAPFTLAEGQTATNSVGNLIVGYAEPRDGSVLRTGSHNVVLGARQEFTSYGGLVAGYDNRAAAPFASVVGGATNEALGAFSSVSGGSFNRAAGDHSIVVGGSRSHASGDGGTVLGGYKSVAAGEYSSVLGGALNRAEGDLATVSGGYGNSAEGSYTTVSGGLQRTATGTYTWVAGSLSEPQ